MFYSEQLLGKTQPLAQVWLVSNDEHRLSKSQILQFDIQSSVGAIFDQGKAPMALRLSGQLMLGVVRIYGRQARYLLGDCNETLLKIRMTFKNTTNDNLLNQQGATLDLNLPDVLTGDDLFPSLDLSFPLTKALNIEVDNTKSFNDDWMSSLAPRISTQARMSPNEAPLLEDDPGLELDLGDDIGFGNNTGMSLAAEVGKNALAARPDELDTFDERDKPLLDDELPFDVGDDVQMTNAPFNTEYDNSDNFLGQDDDGKLLVSASDILRQLHDAYVNIGNKHEDGTTIYESCGPKDFEQDNNDDAVSDGVIPQGKLKDRRFRHKDYEAAIANDEEYDADDEGYKLNSERYEDDGEGYKFNSEQYEDDGEGYKFNSEQYEDDGEGCEKPADTPARDMNPTDLLIKAFGWPLSLSKIDHPKPNRLAYHRNMYNPEAPWLND